MKQRWYLTRLHLSSAQPSSPARLFQATLHVCRTNPQFVQFLEEAEKRPEVANQDLTSFLILPG